MSNPFNIKNAFLRETVDWIIHITIAVVVAVFIINFIAQPTIVDGTSMEPTLHPGDRLMIEKITKRFGSLERGDIVTVYKPQGIPLNHSPIIKRIIGLPGDTIEIKNERVWVNGIALTENYINGNETLEVSPEYSKVTVPQGKIYVIGDNRLPGASNDSRAIGPVDIQKVGGKACFRFYPLKNWGTLNSK